MMGEITIRGTRAQQNLMEWSRRVADCRSSGLSVTRWCTEHNIKPKTYYNWQKKVFAAMLAQQQAELSDMAPIVISRKNFLFANTTNGAQSCAVLFSLIETAKENSLDPCRYLTWGLKEAPKRSCSDPDWAQTLIPQNAPPDCR